MSYILRNNELYIPGERKQLMVDLWNHDQKVFSMIYDVPLHSARFESNGLRRVFMVYLEGKRQPKTLFKNEYGFDVGVIDHLKQKNNYTCIELFGEEFYYNNDCLEQKMLHICRLPGDKPLLTLALELNSGGILAERTELPLNEDFVHSMLFGLCWFLQIPVENAENIIRPVFFHSDHSRRRL